MSVLRVYKYPLEFHGNSYCYFEAPKGARFLKLAFQEGKETVWMMVDPEVEDAEYNVMYSGTGWRLSSDIDQWQYMDTLFAPGGTVWHYFLKPPK